MVDSLATWHPQKWCSFNRSQIKLGAKMYHKMYNKLQSNVCWSCYMCNIVYIWIYMYADMYMYVTVSFRVFSTHQFVEANNILRFSKCCIKCCLCKFNACTLICFNYAKSWWTASASHLWVIIALIKDIVSLTVHVMRHHKHKSF